VNTTLWVSLLLVPVTAALSAAYATIMKRRSVGQQVRQNGPTAHLRKTGTPTMGGIVVIGLWLLVVGLLGWRDSCNLRGFVVLCAGLFAVIGAIDDAMGIHRRHSKGLSGWQKVAACTIIAVGLGLAFPEVLSIPQRVPFTDWTFTLPPVAAIALVWFVLLATTNSVNLTDGLDGLASGTTLLSVVGLLIILSAGSPIRPLLFPLLGILVGFLWINAHPAGLFLGDVGAFGLGGLLAGAAMAGGFVLYVPLLAGVMVINAVSVILQVSWYRLRNQRLFKMAPLHHHFEASPRTGVTSILPSPEWPEQKVTLRFWIVQALFVGLAVLASGPGL